MDSLIEDNQKLYRPSQNGAKCYGHGWNLHEIVVLTETDYVEKTVWQVQPDWDRQILRTHSLAYADGLTVIDGMTCRRRFFEFSR